MVILQAVQLRVPPTLHPSPLHRDQTRLSRLTAEWVQLCALSRALHQQSPGGSSDTVQWGNESLKGGAVCSGVDGDPQGTQLQRELQAAVWPGREGEKKNVKDPRELYSPWNSPGRDTGVGSLSLLQGIFPTKGQNPGLPHCTWVLYQLSHKGSPRILRWVAYPFARGSSRPRNRTSVSCIAGGFFTS